MNSLKRAADQSFTMTFNKVLHRVFLVAASACMLTFLISYLLNGGPKLKAKLASHAKTSVIGWEKNGIWKEIQTKTDDLDESRNVPQKSRTKNVIKVGKRKKQQHTAEDLDERRRRFGGFQMVNDNLSFVSQGYYDESYGVPVVKVIALLSPNMTHNYTCVLQYLGNKFIEMPGYGKHYIPGPTRHYVHKFAYRNGFVICSVPKDAGRPRFLSIHMGKRTSSGRNNITVWYNEKRRYTLTRCVKAFVHNYSDVEQIVWNLEFDRIIGVEKAFVYLESQSDEVVRVLRRYEEEGLVELRNCTVLSPSPGLKKFMKTRQYWGELTSYQDCLFSQTGLSKYVVFHDFDEVIIPYKHTNLVELADDVIGKSDKGPKPASAIIVRNAFFPGFKNKTKSRFLYRSIAEKYNIDPLLYTTRYKINRPGYCVKPIIMPDRVDLMFIHYPEKSKPGYSALKLDPTIALQHHYRKKKNPYMDPPETDTNYVHGFASQLALAVRDRFKKLNIGKRKAVNLK